MPKPWEPLDNSEALTYLRTKDFNAISSMQRIASVEYLVEVELMSVEQIAKKGWLSESSVRHLRRVGRKLAPGLFEYLHSGTLSYGHAKIVVGLPFNQQERIARDVLAKNMSVHRLRKYIKSGSEYDSDEQRRMYEMLARVVSEQLGFPAKIKPSGSGSQNGTLEIKYFGLDGFDHLCDRIKVKLEDL